MQVLPMKHLKIGVVGATGKGQSLATYWHDPDGRSSVIAAMDVSADALERFKAQINPDAQVTQNYEDFLGIEEVDAVGVGSPDFTHEEYVVSAFRAGKHVFCEKPMAITTQGCDRMLKAWRESGKITAQLCWNSKAV